MSAHDSTCKASKSSLGHPDPVALWPLSATCALYRYSNRSRPLQSRSAQEFAKAVTICYTAATVALNVSLFLRPGELDLVAKPPWTRVSAIMAVVYFFDGVRAACTGFDLNRICVFNTRNGVEL